MRRHALGVISVLFMTAWAGLMLLAPQPNNHQVLAAVALRVGAILGALWLALPQLTRIGRHFPPWLIGCLAVSVLLIAVSPRRAVYVLPVLVAIAALQFVGWLFKPPPKRQKHQRI